MTPTDRARDVVLRFQQDGHPYYDELVEMIAEAISDEYKRSQAWELAARKLASALGLLVSSRAGDSRLTQLNKEQGSAALQVFNRLALHHSTLADDG